MQTPIPWDDDPACGHLVAHPHQTHYCTYERVPRLLSLGLATGEHPDEIWILRLLQTYELWLLVFNRDLDELLQAPVAARSTRGDLLKNLRRCSALLQLLEHQTNLARMHLLGERGPQVRVQPWQGETPSTSLARARGQIEQLAAADDGSDGDIASLTRRFEDWRQRFERLLSGLLLPEPGAEYPYDEYLQLGELTSLQNGVKADWSPVGAPPKTIAETEHVSSDELLFIVVHQAFELWFNLMLHELDAVQEQLRTEPTDLSQAKRRMQRVVDCQKLLVEQIHMPATMRPNDFLQFRHETRTHAGETQERGLSPASGTESYQFREIEIIGGLAQDQGYQELLYGNEDMHIRFLTPAQEQRLKQPSLPDLFESLLQRRGVSELSELYPPPTVDNPYDDLAQLADLLLEFDEFFQLWRVHHVMMVQSMIGQKSGTGFLGPEYLRETVGMGSKLEQKRLLDQPQRRPRFFEELWRVRTRLQGQSPLEQA